MSVCVCLCVCMHVACVCVYFLVPGDCIEFLSTLGLKIRPFRFNPTEISEYGFSVLFD